VVTPTNGDPFAGALASVDASGRVTFRTDSEGRNRLRSLPLTDVVRWSYPVRPKPRTLVLLDDGSRLVTAAEWAGGAAVRLDGDSWVVLTDTWDEVRLPKSRVRGLVFAQRSRPQQRERWERDVRSARAAEDQVLLTNGDRVSGTVVRLAGGTLALATEAGEAELPLSRVEAVAFALRNDPKITNGSGTEPPKSVALVGLRDGSLLYANSLATDEESLEVELEGVRLSGGTRDDVAALQSLGGEFVYLSDFEPIDYRHVPYLAIPWPYERDRNARGEPLVVDGNTYLKGLGMHSAGRLTYRLDGTFRRFDAEVAVDAAAAGRGSVVFGVHLLRDGKWQEAYSSGTVRGGDRPVPVSVDLRGAQGLTLTVDYADRGDERDYADWLDARLVK
jgi:hypothetical protein